MFLPGVPFEMKRMFEEQVSPRIRSLAPQDSFQLRLRTFGLPESAVGERLRGVEELFPGVTIGYQVTLESNEEVTPRSVSPSLSASPEAVLLGMLRTSSSATSGPNVPSPAL